MRTGLGPSPRLSRPKDRTELDFQTLIKGGSDTNRKKRTDTARGILKGIVGVELI
jgi:hypothetical protein